MWVRRMLLKHAAYSVCGGVRKVSEPFFQIEAVASTIAESAHLMGEPFFQTGAESACLMGEPFF